MAAKAESNAHVALKMELKLQLNQSLFEKGVISRELYETAKMKIVADT